MDKENINGIKKYLNCIIGILILIALINIHQSYVIHKTDKYRTSTYDKVGELWKRKDFQGLLEYSEKILQKNPKDENALFGKAEALYQLKRWEEAEEAFIKVKEHVPAWSNNVNKYLKIIRENL